MKKLLAVLLAGTMALSLAACGGGQNNSRYGYKSSGRYDGCRHGECGSRRKGRRGYGTDRPS